MIVNSAANKQVELKTLKWMLTSVITTDKPPLL